MKSGNLFVSFFYGQKGWHVFIKEFLLKKQGLIYTDNQSIYSIIHFSLDRGSQIGLTCPFWNQNDQSNFLTELQKEAKFFFSTHPVKVASQFRHGETLFKNFSPNAIHFNIHQFPFSLAVPSLSKDIVWRITSHLTKLIVEIVSNEPIDNFTLFTFSFYLHLLYFKSLDFSLPETRECMLKLSEGSSFLKNGLHESEIESFYLELLKENGEVFLQIIFDILTGSFENTPDAVWMLNSISCFRSIWGEISESRTVFNEEKFIAVMAVVNNQLGLNQDTTSIFLLFYKSLMNKSAT